MPPSCVLLIRILGRFLRLIDELLIDTWQPLCMGAGRIPGANLNALPEREAAGRYRNGAKSQAKGVCS